jgi:outer membrane protein assembly factor BamB
MQYTTSVIIGDNIYFGNSFGVFYCLNKFTGATVWFGQLDQGVWYSPTTDGTDIFVGTSDGYLAAMPAVGGTVYKLAAAGDGAGGMSVLYTWDGYDAALEGFVTAPVYNADENAIYVNGNLGIGVGTNNYYEGLLMKLSAVDLTQIFSSWYMTMNPYFVTPNLMPFPWERITCGGAHSLYWFFTTTASLSALRQFTLAGSLAWYGSDQEMYFPSGGGPYWGNQSCSFASTCDPYLFGFQYPGSVVRQGGHDRREHTQISVYR